MLYTPKTRSFDAATQRQNNKATGRKSIKHLSECYARPSFGALSVVVPPEHQNTIPYKQSALHKKRYFVSLILNFQCDKCFLFLLDSFFTGTRFALIELFSVSGLRGERERERESIRHRTYSTLHS